jgi:excisionase family DNA binding protein
MNSESQTPGHEGRLSFSIIEAAAMTGLGRDAIYRAINSGHLVARKVGNRTIINRHDLERFLHSLPHAGNGKAA